MDRISKVVADTGGRKSLHLGSGSRSADSWQARIEVLVLTVDLSSVCVARR